MGAGDPDRECHSACCGALGAHVGKGGGPQFAPLGPFPVRDSLGMGVAIAMLVKSREPGRYQMSHQQFETIWKLRAGFSKFFMASKEGVLSLRSVGSSGKTPLDAKPYSVPVV